MMGLKYTTNFVYLTIFAVPRKKQVFTGSESKNFETELTFTL